MKSHLKETDQEVPHRMGNLDWLYYPRTIEGKSYKLHCRSKSKKDDDFVEGKDIKAQFVSKPRPTYLYGYGSYGACMEPSFGMSRLPLLDRGMAYVIAHIRGGSELGRG